MAEAIEAKFTDPEGDLERLFSEMQEGYKVQVNRLEPDWCKGTVGTYEYDPGEPISMQWIEKKFGGTKLQIKIKTPDNAYTGSRTITFPVAPKRNGQEIVPGPNDIPILKSEAAMMQGQPPPQNTDLVNALEKIMHSQAQQNQALQSMLINRVSGLEALLTQKIETTGNGQQQQGQPYDPNAQLKTTLETFKMMEELRESLGGGTGGDDDENPMLSKVMDKVIDKLTEKLTDEKPASTQEGSPPLPDREEPSNMELAQLIKTRMGSMDSEEKEFYMSQVFENEEEEDDDLPAGQSEDLGLESLLSGEDQAQLNGANGSTSSANDGQAD